jgi:hypothetical protein
MLVAGVVPRRCKCVEMSGSAWVGVELCSLCGCPAEPVCLTFLSLFHGSLNMPGGVCLWVYVHRPRALVLLWGRIN